MRKTTQYVINGVILEEGEYNTILFLKSKGMRIEVLRPTSIPRSNNPDIMMQNTIWEIKTITTTNLKTIKKRVHKASLQSCNIIFDLRAIRSQDLIVDDLIKRFKSKTSIRKMIIVKDDDTMIDLSK